MGKRYLSCGVSNVLPFGVGWRWDGRRNKKQNTGYNRREGGVECVGYKKASKKKRERETCPRLAEADEPRVAVVLEVRHGGQEHAHDHRDHRDHQRHEQEDLALGVPAHAHERHAEQHERRAQADHAQVVGKDARERALRGDEVGRQRGVGAPFPDGARELGRRGDVLREPRDVAPGQRGVGAAVRLEPVHAAVLVDVDHGLREADHVHRRGHGLRDEEQDADAAADGRPERARDEVVAAAALDLAVGADRAHGQRRDERDHVREQDDGRAHDDAGLPQGCDEITTQTNNICRSLTNRNPGHLHLLYVWAGGGGGGGIT